MRQVIVVVVTAADQEAIEGMGYERALAQLQAEVAALEVRCARASAERHGRFQKRLESTRRELRETGLRLKNGIDILEQERNGTVQRLHEQLAHTQPDAREAIERRLADVQAEYRARIRTLTRAWELAESAIAR